MTTDSKTTSARTTRGRGRHVAQYTPWKPSPTRYSEDHQASLALMDEFISKTAEQEEMYVNAGFDAEGLTDFVCRLFQAWEHRDLDRLRACWADDLVYADPTGGARDYVATQQELIDLYSILFHAAPDMAFWPQDSAQRSLITYDFLDGKVRIVIPWRMVLKFKFAPRSVDSVGTDRYDMVRDPERGWLIQRIDTDGDLLGALTQLLPFKGFNGMRQETAGRLVRAVLRVRPQWRGPRVRPFLSDSR